MVYWVTGGLLAAYLVLVWFLGMWLPVKGSDVWLLRGGLAIIGVIAAGIFLWFHHKTKKAQIVEEGAAPGGGTADIDLLVHEAVRRLKSSTLGRGTTIASLPVVFLLGESGSTKTTTIVHSALDPELLAGQAFQDANIVPTRVSNVWYTREAVFVDPAGGLMTEPGRWKRLIKLVQPRRVSAAFGKGQQAPRAAIVCCDCAEFLRSGASESMISTARKLAVRLQNVSQLLTISFPVYVLFTKVDRLSFFEDFARGLTKEEAAQVLGATLPVRPAAGGVYAEEETRRLTKAFDELFYSLAEKRMDLLSREREGDKLPGIYEFPRELRKLRTLMVQFLVELARPSHLSVNPFLRGFYFSGVRPVIVEELVQATPQARSAEAGFEGGATRIFTSDEARQRQAPTPARVAGSRKVPQWVFLTQLFNDVIVKDRVALATSGFSTQVSLLRRILLVCVAVVAVVCLIGFVVSYFGNRALLSQVREAQAATFSEPPAGQAPSLSDLERLEATGQLLDTLGNYDRDGAPLRLRWGLYSGDELYSQVCGAYARGLNRLLLGPTRASMASSLTQLAYQPYSGASNQQEYDKAYSTLKTYLMTTSETRHAKDDVHFATHLYASWPAHQNATAQQQDLANRQFDRYANDLKPANASACLAYPPDERAVGSARTYLNRFPPDQRMYQAMLAEAAAKGGGDIDFNATYADAAVRDDHRVPAQFTKPGWAAMMVALSMPEHYLSGEAWVLGASTQAATDARAYVATVRDRYQKAFINEWLEFLAAARFLGFKGPADVGLVAGGRSALLMVLCVTSENKGIDKDVANAFTAATALVPSAGCESKVTGPMNKPYADALFALSDCLDKLHSTPVGADWETQRKECADKQRAATELVSQMVAENQGTDSAANRAVEALLIRPVKALEPPPPQQPPGAQDVCSALIRLGQDFPNGGSAFDELQNVFKSGGLLDQHPAPPNPNPRYQSFYKKAKEIQQALYPDGKTLQLRYTITALPSEGVQNFRLMTATQSLSSFNTPKEFAWKGDPEDKIQLNIESLPPVSKSGPLSIFQFVADAGENGQPRGPNYYFDVPVKLQVGNQTASQQTLRFMINAGSANTLFSRGSLGSLGCTPKVGQ